MQEKQQTTTSNIIYDLSSVLYHELQAAQTCSSYIQDAEQAGQQELASFLRQVQQDANKHAEHARRLLAQVGTA
jgi:pyrroloquinoline quinone (PQQ) biosynthesis protein C